MRPTGLKAGAKPNQGTLAAIQPLKRTLPQSRTLAPKRARETQEATALLRKKGLSVSLWSQQDHPLLISLTKTVLAVDASPLPPAHQDRLEVDTSNLSLRDNAGRPLIDENPTSVEPVVVADFGLDAPDTILPTSYSPQPLEAPDTARPTIQEDAGNLVAPSELDRSEPITIQTDHLSMD